MKTRAMGFYWGVLALILFFCHSSRLEPSPSPGPSSQPADASRMLPAEDNEEFIRESRQVQREHAALTQAARAAVRWEINEPTRELNRGVSYGIIGIAEHQRAYSIEKYRDEPAPYYLAFCYDPDKHYPWHVLSATSRDSGKPFEPIRWQSYENNWIHPLDVVMKPHTMLFYHCLHGNGTSLNIVVDGFISCRYNEKALFPMNHIQVMEAIPHIYTCWPLIQKVMKGRRTLKEEQEKDEL